MSLKPIRRWLARKWPYRVLHVKYPGVVSSLIVSREQARAVVGNGMGHWTFPPCTVQLHCGERLGRDTWSSIMRTPTTRWQRLLGQYSRDFVPAAAAAMSALGLVFFAAGILNLLRAFSLISAQALDRWLALLFVVATVVVVRELVVLALSFYAFQLWKRRKAHALEQRLAR